MSGYIAGAVYMLFVYVLPNLTSCSGYAVGEVVCVCNILNIAAIFLICHNIPVTVTGSVLVSEFIYCFASMFPHTR